MKRKCEWKRRENCETEIRKGKPRWGIGEKSERIKKEKLRKSVMKKWKRVERKWGESLRRKQGNEGKVQGRKGGKS